MSQAQLLQSAKQGDTEAIKTLLNQSLSSRKVEVIEATIEDNFLTLKVSSRKVPNQYKLMPFLEEELKSLAVVSIDTVIVHGMTPEAPTPLWEASFSIDPDNTFLGNVVKLDVAAVPPAETTGESESEEESPPEPEPEPQPEPQPEPFVLDEKDRELMAKYAPSTTLERVRKESPNTSLLLSAFGVGAGIGFMLGMAVSSMNSQPSTEPTPAVTSTPSPTTP